MMLSRRELLGASALLLAGTGVAPRAAVAREAAQGAGPLVLCWNENPYGPSPAARAAVSQSVASAFRYPSDEEVAALVAAIAQVEGSGNPVARTYWRWSWSSQVFEIYRPASSAVGMYQMTDGTFAEARRYCIHDHAVVADGPWYAWRSCWFNRFYARVVPGDAIELTSAYLDRSVTAVLDRHRRQATSLRLKQEVAAILHLCGAGVASEYVGRGFRLTEAQRCGDHDVRTYLARVDAMKATFARLANHSS